MYRCYTEFFDIYSGPLFTEKSFPYRHRYIRPSQEYHDNVIKWKHFPCYCPFVRGIQQSPVDSPHKVQWHGALMFFLICAWTNGCANNRGAGDLWRYRFHYDAIVLIVGFPIQLIRHLLWIETQNISTSSTCLQIMDSIAHILIILTYFYPVIGCF